MRCCAEIVEHREQLGVEAKASSVRKLFKILTLREEKQSGVPSNLVCIRVSKVSVA